MCYNVGIEQLASLLSGKLQGAVELTHDESAHNWKRALNGYPLVYGIREAKGLEFKSVVRNWHVHHSLGIHFVIVNCDHAHSNFSFVDPFKFLHRASVITPKGMAQPDFE